MLAGGVDRSIGAVDSDIEEEIHLDDRVLVRARQRARRAGVEGEVEMLATAIFHFDGERIARLEFYAEREGGFRAAGYSPGP